MGFFHWPQSSSPLRILQEILAKVTSMDKRLMTLEEQAQALKDDVDRVLADQATAIKNAVAAALGAQGVSETNAQAIMASAQDAIDAFDPPPVTPPAPPAA